MVQITRCIFAIGYVAVRSATEEATREGTKFCSIWCAGRQWK